MNAHIESLFEHHHRWITVPLILIAVTLVTLANIVGYPDNMTGLVLVYSGMAALVVAFTYTWRSPVSFLVLAGACLFGIPAMGLVDHLFAALADAARGIHWLHATLGTTSFVFATVSFVLCPVCVVVGVIGSVIRFVRTNDGSVVS